MVETIEDVKERTRQFEKVESIIRDLYISLNHLSHSKVSIFSWRDKRKIQTLVKTLSSCIPFPRSERKTIFKLIFFTTVEDSVKRSTKEKYYYEKVDFTSKSALNSSIKLFCGQSKLLNNSSSIDITWDPINSSVLLNGQTLEECLLQDSFLTHKENRLQIKINRIPVCILGMAQRAGDLFGSMHEIENFLKSTLEDIRKDLTRTSSFAHGPISPAEAAIAGSPPTISSGEPQRLSSKKRSLFKRLFGTLQSRKRKSILNEKVEYVKAGLSQEKGQDQKSSASNHPPVEYRLLEELLNRGFNSEDLPQGSLSPLDLLGDALLVVVLQDPLLGYLQGFNFLVLFLLEEFDFATAVNVFLRLAGTHRVYAEVPGAKKGSKHKRGDPTDEAFSSEKEELLAKSLPGLWEGLVLSEKLRVPSLGSSLEDSRAGNREGGNRASFERRLSAIQNDLSPGVVGLGIRGLWTKGFPLLAVLELVGMRYLLLEELDLWKIFQFGRVTAPLGKDRAKRLSKAYKRLVKSKLGALKDKASASGRHVQEGQADTYDRFCSSPVVPLSVLFSGRLMTLWTNCKDRDFSRFTLDVVVTEGRAGLVKLLISVVLSYKEDILGFAKENSHNVNIAGLAKVIDKDYFGYGKIKNISSFYSEVNLSI